MGLYPECCENEASFFSLHSGCPGVPQGTPQQGSLQKSTRDLLPPAFSQSITCDSSSQSLHDRECEMGSKQASPSVWEAAGTTVDNPRHSLSGSMCCSCFGGWEEPQPMGSVVMLLSNSPHDQDKSISAWYCQTQGLMLPVLPVVFFW